MNECEDYMFLLGGTTKTAVLFKCIVNYYLDLITATLPTLVVSTLMAFREYFHLPQR